MVKAERALARLSFNDVAVDKNVAKISAVGIGMQSNSGVAATFFQALSDKKINVRAISTSEIKISVLVNGDVCQQAVNAVHNAFRLGVK